MLRRQVETGMSRYKLSTVVAAEDCDDDKLQLVNHFREHEAHADNRSIGVISEFNVFDCIRR